MNNLSHSAKWLFLSIAITKSKLIKLYNHFENTDNIFEATREDYEKLSFLKSKDIDALCKRDFTQALQYENICIKNDIHIITRDNELFPKKIMKITNFPSVIFCRGNIQNLNDKNCISVVGSRTPGSYGKDATYSLSSYLAGCGFCVVSGMADGIDSIAHKAAIDSGGFTVAVLGCGPDIIYPKGNMYIYEQILKKGMIISEYLPGTSPQKYYFPERNKIIASLSLGTVVTEANIKSGSLITAEYALKYERDVFALPGNINSKLSGGTNELIKKGAHMVVRCEDIYNFYKSYLEKNDFSYITAPPKKQISYNGLTDNEKLIVKNLETEEMNMDMLLYKTGLSMSLLSTSLLMLELKEIIKKTDTDTYSLVIY